MKQATIIISFFLILAFNQFVIAQPGLAEVKNKFNNEELRFTENKGQVTDIEGNLRKDILFTAQSAGVKLFITNNGIYYQFSRKFLSNEKSASLPDSKDGLPRIDSMQLYRLDMQLVNSNKHPEIIKEGEGKDYANFFLANCPNGILGVKNYNRIIYKNVYPNIDWIIYCNGNMMEYDFLVSPGGDISKIKIKYGSASKIKIDPSRNILIETPLGLVKENKPICFQEKNHEIKSSFILSNNIIGFDCNYDKTKPLIIDPSLIWATYYGGNIGESGTSCAVDSSGNIYLCGSTTSNIGIAYNGFKNTISGSNDAFLVKFNSEGQRLWCTYYGGDSTEDGNSCTVDKFGNIYLLGTTYSSNNIAFAGFQNNFNGGSDYGGDAFLVKFNSSGSRLWSTYYGGSGGERGYTCATDNSGNVYVSGITNSSSAIASLGYQNTFGGFYDAFLVKFNPSGSRIWGTYYGGNDWDEGRSCAVDISGNVYLTGPTSSYTGISFNGFQNNYAGGFDAFLVKFSSDGMRVWGTYYGGDNYDDAYGCTTDVNGNIYITGWTISTFGISANGFQNKIGDPEFANYYGDAFLIKFNTSGTRLWGTYYGSSCSDYGFNCTTDNNSNVYLVGQTCSSKNIAQGGIQNSIGGSYDAFLIKFNPSGARIWGTYYGGSGSENGKFCISDKKNNIYLVGSTLSSTHIAQNGFQDSLKGFSDAFLTKIYDITNCLPPTISTNDSTTNLCPTDTITLTSSNAASYLWSTGATTKSIKVKSGGSYTVTVTYQGGCSNTSAATVVTYQTCVAPTSLRAREITSTSAKLLWKATSCAVRYRVQYKPVTSATWKSQSVVNPSIVLNNLTPNTTYDWQVATLCKTSPSEIISNYRVGADFSTLTSFVKTSDSSYLESKDKISYISVIPNPTSSIATLFIQKGKEQIVSVSIADLAGKIMWKSEHVIENKINLPVEKLSSGVYLVTVFSSKESKTIKFVKQ